MTIGFLYKKDELTDNFYLFLDKKYNSIDVLTEIDIIFNETDEILKNPNVVLCIYDFSSAEIIDLKHRFFTENLDISINSSIDKTLLNALKNISTSDDLPEGYINSHDLDIFMLKTDANFANTDDNYLMLCNKDLALPYNYAPENTRIVQVTSTRQVYLENQTAFAVEQMFAQAKKEGIYLTLISGYRDFEYQNLLFQRKIASVGYESANKVVARPGESEHQTGLVVDISSSSINLLLLTSFANTREGIWLYNNCADFGFILRYAKDKVDITGYSYEPWHFRYVGDVEIANFIMSNNLTLEEYHELYMN